jgi:hypothetical protein
MSLKNYDLLLNSDIGNEANSGVGIGVLNNVGFENVVSDSSNSEGVQTPESNLKRDILAEVDAKLTGYKGFHKPDSNIEITNGVTSCSNLTAPLTWKKFSKKLISRKVRLNRDQTGVDLTYHFNINQMDDNGNSMYSGSHLIPNSVKQEVPFELFDTTLGLVPAANNFGMREADTTIDKNHNIIFEGEAVALENIKSKVLDRVELKIKPDLILGPGDIDLNSKLSKSQDILNDTTGLVQRIAITLLSNEMARSFSNVRRMHQSVSMRKNIIIEKLVSNTVEAKSQVLNRSDDNLTMYAVGSGYKACVLTALFISHFSFPVLYTNDYLSVPRLLTHNGEDDNGEVTIVTDNPTLVRDLLNRFRPNPNLFFDDYNVNEVVEYCCDFIGQKNLNLAIEEFINSYFLLTQFSETGLLNIKPVILPSMCGLFHLAKEVRLDKLDTYQILDRSKICYLMQQSLIFKNWLITTVQNDVNTSITHYNTTEANVISDNLSSILASIISTFSMKYFYYDSCLEAFGIYSNYGFLFMNRKIIKGYFESLRLQVSQDGDYNISILTPDDFPNLLAVYTPDNRKYFKNSLGEAFSGNISLTSNIHDNQYIKVNSSSIVLFSLFLQSIQRAYPVSDATRLKHNVVGLINDETDVMPSEHLAKLYGTNVKVQLFFREVEYQLSNAREVVDSGVYKETPVYENNSFISNLDLNGIDLPNVSNIIENIVPEIVEINGEGEIEEQGSEESGQRFETVGKTAVRDLNELQGDDKSKSASGGEKNKQLEPQEFKQLVSTYDKGGSYIESVTLIEAGAMFDATRAKLSRNERQLGLINSSKLYQNVEVLTDLFSNNNERENSFRSINSDFNLLKDERMLELIYKQMVDNITNKNNLSLIISELEGVLNSLNYYRLRINNDSQKFKLDKDLLARKEVYSKPAELISLLRKLELMIGWAEQIAKKL